MITIEKLDVYQSLLVVYSDVTFVFKIIFSSPHTYICNILYLRVIRSFTSCEGVDDTGVSVAQLGNR